MLFKVGDKVRFLNETGGGTVKEVISEHLVVVETPDEFDYSYPTCELVHESSSFDYPLDAFDIGEKPPGPVLNIPQKEKKTNVEMEVDLHIENLTNDIRGMDHFDMLQMQLDEVKRALEEVRKKKGKKVIFIHGVGEGKLKEEVRKLLDGYANLEYFDASFSKYGLGATEVALRYN